MKLAKLIFCKILYIIGIILIKFYRYIISPLLTPSCRFTPSCSEYALEAIKTHGPIKGSWLTCKRLLRCLPFCKYGYDPVPRKTINK